MVRFYRPASDELNCVFARQLDGRETTIWREVRRSWRGDPIRRRHEIQLTQLGHAIMLDQAELWIAWDDAPTDHREWGGPHYCLGLVVVVADPNSLTIQFASGRRLRRWIPLAVRALEDRAARDGPRRIELYCRSGWKHELAPCWKWPVTVHRDPELLRVYPTRHTLRPAVRRASA
jgi:hypothetical protein